MHKPSIDNKSAAALTDKVLEMYEGASDEVKNAAVAAAGAVAATSTRGGRAIVRGAKGATTSVSRFAQAHPVWMGLIVVGAGAAIAAAIVIPRYRSDD